MNSFILGAVLVVFLPFFMRWHRTSEYAFAHMHRRFLAYRKAGFVGSEVTVLFSDWRVDRYAKGSFHEKHAPCACVYLCVNAKGQHYLWKLYEPAMDEPTLTKLSADEAEESLGRKKTLLAQLCPKQK
jgi:hypothetical protein